MRKLAIQPVFKLCEFGVQGSLLFGRRLSFVNSKCQSGKLWQPVVSGEDHATWIGCAVNLIEFLRGDH
jgi:hypothetical protein